MRLFSGKIPTIAQEIVTTLSAAQDIETEAPNEVALDIESVLKEYVRAERRVVDEAKARMESRGLGFGELGRVKSQVARDMKIPVGEDTLPYLVDQILEMLFHSSHVQEVFAEDAALRKKATTVLRRHMDVEAELDREVRSKIKNLEEGTAAFETEYQKTLDALKRTKRLT